LQKLQNSSDCWKLPTPGGKSFCFLLLAPNFLVKVGGRGCVWQREWQRGCLWHCCTDTPFLISNLRFREEIASLQEQLWFAGALLQQMYRGCGLTATVRMRRVNQITLAHGGWV